MLITIIYQELGSPILIFPRGGFKKFAVPSAYYIDLGSPIYNQMSLLVWAIYTSEVGGTEHPY
jgi:hypothetical protein